MSQSQLEITILYYSNEGREVPFTSLTNKLDAMDEADYGASNFWNIFGGFDVTINGHYTIFHSCNFYCLVKATSFLLQSLYWIKEKECDWFDKENITSNSVIMNPSPNTTLKLQKTKSSYILFSYLPTDETYEHKRGDRFFSEIKLGIDTWYQQTNLALSEYFSVLKDIVYKSEKLDDTTQIIIEYLKVWQDIN